MNLSLYSQTGRVMRFLSTSWYRCVYGTPVYGLMETCALGKLAMTWSWNNM